MGKKFLHALGGYGLLNRPSTSQFGGLLFLRIPDTQMRVFFRLADCDPASNTGEQWG
jgi:hypothetical protein